jgi:di/tricarboxylate transporter
MDLAAQLDPPERKESPEAPKEAERRLKAMGPMTFPQKVRS